MGLPVYNVSADVVNNSCLGKGAEMEGNIDAIYKKVCQSVLWIVCPFCKYFAEVLPVVKGVFNMISAFSPHSWLRPLQKALGLPMEEGEVVEECCEWLEFSQRTTVLFTSLLKEFEDLLEHFEVDTHSDGSSDVCSAATITQCRRDHLSRNKTKELTIEYNPVVCQTAAKALLPNMEPFDNPTSTTARHKLSWPTAAEEAGLTAPCGQQHLHVYRRGAHKRWRRVFLVIRAARVLFSFIKPKEDRSICPARPRVGSYTPARPPLLPCPPSFLQAQSVEAKSAPIMIFSDGPQIHLISQELRAKLESLVRRKRTHRVFGFPPKLAKILGDSAAYVLKSRDACVDQDAPRSFSKPKSAVNPKINAAGSVVDSVFLNVIDLKNTEQLEGLSNSKQASSGMCG